MNTGNLLTTISRAFSIGLALAFSVQFATAQRVPSPRTKVGPRGWIKPTNQGKGHPIRYRLPVRPLNYRINPDPNDPS
ncbi:MAG: hypothetical protein HOL43_11265, partial [Verrucomicrobiales bacterium]|nr:hypothetical protein [Verrucomicrobiales bacterium]